MKDRIRELRKSLNLTQEQFAAPLSLSSNYIYMIETGSKPISDKVVAAICERYNINEEWLRTGSGDMHPPLSRAEEIAQVVGGLLDESDPFKLRLVSLVSSLSPEQVQNLKDIARDLLKEE